MRLFLSLAFALLALTAIGQKKKNETPAVPAPPTSSFEAKIAGLRKMPGYFELYYDEKQDKMLLLIDKFDTEFLYVESLTAGVGSNDIGLDRNQLGRDRVVRFERRGPKVLLVEPNQSFRAISNRAAERQAVEEAFAQSVLFGFTVVAEQGASALVDATDFFLQDVHDVIGTLRSAQQGSYTLDKSRSAFYLPRTRNFPDNTEVEVTLTFTGQPTGNYIRSVVPTPTSLTVREHHSFVKLPDGNYRPRVFDPRAGFFSISYYDYATPISEPIEKRFITRHRLEKKNPGAALSEAVEPIIYYMDPGAPEPIRSALMEGARWWNQAFEAAGYKDAFRVELLPEGADPMDVRYNVINWVHRSTRGWSYGASVTDPRTGEIIKGHVTLGSLRVRQDFLIAEGLLSPYETGKPVSPDMEKLALDRLKQLAAHEVGHTLGLSHAYSSSTENLASVMDYPHPLVRVMGGKVNIQHAYDGKIGAFDNVSIAYGYADVSEASNEKEALNAIIQNSLKAGLTFLSDQDARPVGGAHPYAHLWDNGADAAEELNRILDVRAVALTNFGENTIKPGMPMALLEEALVPIYFFHRYQTEAAAKLVGGLNYRYALRGDGQPITEFVPPAKQQAALDALLKTVQPEVLTLPEALLKSIPPRPLGYQRHRELVKIKTELTFDALAVAETAADMTFGLLLHPARANRLVEYHAREASQPSLASILDKATASVLKTAVNPGLAGAVQQSIQHAWITNLIKLANHTTASAQTKAIAQAKLKNLQAWLAERARTTPNEAWKAHDLFLAALVARSLEAPEEFKTEAALPPPPGQPIGMTCGQDETDHLK
jgi:hypothetical protein